MFIAQTAIENTTSFCPKSDGCELAGGLEATNKKFFLLVRLMARGICGLFPIALCRAKACSKMWL